MAKGDKIDVRFKIRGRGRKKARQFRLTMDDKQYVLEEVVLSTGEKTKGEERFVNPAFLTNMKSVGRSLAHYGLADSDAATVTEMREALDYVLGQIAEQFDVPAAKALGA